MSNMRAKLMEGLKKRESSMLADPHLDRIGNSVRKSKTPTSKEKIYEIPVEAIQENPFQYRTEESLESSELKSLAKSIAEHGLRTPIQLRQKDGDYILVAGWRRLTAIKRFIKSMKTVKATVDTNMDDKTHRLLTVLENEQREDFTLFEKASAYNDMRNIDKLTLDEIADVVGSSKTRISRVLKLLILPDAVSTLLRKALLDGLSNGHLDELVAGFKKRVDAGHSEIEAREWISHMVTLIVSENYTIADLREENRGELKPREEANRIAPKKPLKKWNIKGGEWKKFEVSTRNKVTLEFKLPEDIQYNDSEKIIHYIKERLLKENQRSN